MVMSDSKVKNRTKQDSKSDSTLEWERISSRGSEKEESPNRIPDTFLPVVPASRVKPVLFNYPPLPRWEFALYFISLISIFAYGWYCIYALSWQLNNKVGLWFGFSTYGRWIWVDHPLFGYRLKDESNWEWIFYRNFLPHAAPMLLLHSVMFNAVDYLVSPDKPFIQQIIRTILAVPISCGCFGWYPVIATIVQGVLLYTVTRFTRSQIAMWISVLPVMYTVMHSNYIFGGEAFVPMLLGSYKCLMYISYSIEFLRGNVPQDNKDNYLKGLLRMFHYSFYMPFGASVIVTYAQFEQQLIERKNMTRDWKQIVGLFVRLVFWYFVIESMLCFFYFELILKSEKTLRSIRLDELTTLGAAIGQFFHLKYVIIFGIPRLFAKIDKMQPPEGPICTTRVVLFSNIWRYFDRGLYHFFKEYIFLPICRPTFSLWRKIFGVLMAYGFVLHWHGYTRSNTVWIFFNIVELFQEALAKYIYGIPAVRKWREHHISDGVFRRIIALLQVCPLAFSLYSNFYFLGGGAAGWVFVDRIFWGETVTFQYPFPLLVAIGYIYINVVMTVEQHLYDKETAKQKEIKSQ